MLTRLYAGQYYVLAIESVESPGSVERDADVVRCENREFVRRDAPGFEFAFDAFE